MPLVQRLLIYALIHAVAHSLFASPEIAQALREQRASFPPTEAEWSVTRKIKGNPDAEAAIRQSYDNQIANAEAANDTQTAEHLKKTRDLEVQQITKDQVVELIVSVRYADPSRYYIGITHSPSAQPMLFSYYGVGADVYRVLDPFSNVEITRNREAIFQESLRGLPLFALRTEDFDAISRATAEKTASGAVRLQFNESRKGPNDLDFTYERLYSFDKSGDYLMGYSVSLFATFNGKKVPIERTSIEATPMKLPPKETGIPKKLRYERYKEETVEYSEEWVLKSLKPLLNPERFDSKPMIPPDYTVLDRRGKNPVTLTGKDLRIGE